MADTSLLMQRLLGSSGGKLLPLFTLGGFEEHGGQCCWRCGAVSVDDSVTLFLLSETIYFLPKDGTAAGDTPPERRGVLPLLLLQSSHSQLMDVQPLEDVFLHFDLLNPPDLPVEVPASTAVLLSQVTSLHATCYLQLLHSALSHGLPLAPQDFRQGLQVCDSASLCVDATPLLAAHCGHAKTSFLSQPDLEPAPPPLTSDLLCLLLSAALSKRTWTCVLSSADAACGEEGEESHCVHCTQELNQTFCQHLEGLGFKKVTQCGPAHFWLDREMEMSAAESTMVSERGCSCPMVTGLCVCWHRPLPHLPL